MCELLGLTSDKKIRMNELLETFFSHSVEHPDGWGLALLDQDPISIEKEPKKAADSSFLKELLAQNIETSQCVAHIRKASIGEVSLKNTHPFLKHDAAGRLWVLAHNGTLFDPRVIAPYRHLQEGATDSESVLIYIIDEINKRPDSDREEVRIRVVEDVVRSIVSPDNRLNLLLYDGDCFYVHTNHPGSLHKKEENGTVLFSTRPLENTGWEEAPQNRLMVFRRGQLICIGQKHGGTYIHDEERMNHLYRTYSQL